MARSLLDLCNRMREHWSNIIGRLKDFANHAGKAFVQISWAVLTAFGKATWPPISATLMLFVLFLISFGPAVILLRAFNPADEFEFHNMFWQYIIEPSSALIREKFEDLYRWFGGFAPLISVASSLSLLGYIFTKGIGNLTTILGRFPCMVRGIAFDLCLINHPRQPSLTYKYKKLTLRSKISKIILESLKTASLFSLMLVTVIGSILATIWSLNYPEENDGVKSIVVEYSPTEQITVPILQWQDQGQLSTFDGICLDSDQIRILKKFEAWLLSFADTYPVTLEIEIRGYASVAPVSSMIGYSGSDAFNLDIANSRAATVIAFLLDSEIDRKEWPCRCYEERFDQSWIEANMDRDGDRMRQYPKEHQKFRIVHHPWDTYDQMIRLKPEDDGTFLLRKSSNEYRNRSVDAIFRITKLVADNPARSQ